MLQLQDIDCPFHSGHGGHITSLHHAITEDQRRQIRTAEVYEEFMFCWELPRDSRALWGPCDVNTGSLALYSTGCDRGTLPPSHDNMISSIKLSVLVYTSFIKYLEPANKFAKLSVSCGTCGTCGRYYWGILTQELQLPLTPDTDKMYRYCGLEGGRKILSLTTTKSDISSCNWYWYLVRITSSRVMK